jgi:hypothetical protein
MKKIFILPLLMLVVLSCQDNGVLIKILSETQNLSVFIYKDEGNKRTKTLVYETGKRDEIEKFAAYISDESSPDYKCGYDGVIEMKTAKDMVEMSFNLQNECKHIVYIAEGKRYTKKLTEAGWKFLKSFYDK